MNKLRRKLNPDKINLAMYHHIAAFAVINKGLEQANQELPAVAYAAYHDLKIKDFFAAINSSINHPKLNYYIRKLLSNKTKGIELITEGYKLTLQIELLGSFLPNINRVSLNQLGLPILSSPSIVFDYSLYGDGLTQKDWSEIWADVTLQIRKLAKEIFGDNLPKDFNDQMVELYTKIFMGISVEYGIHPAIVMIKTASNKDSEIVAMGQKVVQSQEQRKRQKQEEENLLNELEKLEELEEENIKRSHAYIPYQEIGPEITQAKEWGSTHKPKLFIVGGERFNVPEWIKDSFDIRHATGSISGDRAKQLLGTKLPDAILILRFVSHSTAVPITDLARDYKIPMLVAKPSVSAAIKHAEIFGPTWFSDAYFQFLRRTKRGGSEIRRNPRYIEMDLTPEGEWQQAHQRALEQRIREASEYFQDILPTIQASSQKLKHHQAKLAQSSRRRAAEWAAKHAAEERARLEELRNQDLAKNATFQYVCVSINFDNLKIALDIPKISRKLKSEISAFFYLITLEACNFVEYEASELEDAQGIKLVFFLHSDDRDRFLEYIEKSLSVGMGIMEDVEQKIPNSFILGHLLEIYYSSESVKGATLKNAEKWAQDSYSLYHYPLPEDWQPPEYGR